MHVPDLPARCQTPRQEEPVALLGCLTMEGRLTVVRGSDALGAWLETGLADLPAHLARAATLVLPSHRLAHRLRRAACLRGTPGLLAGVRLRRPGEVAREVLVRAAP